MSTTSTLDDFGKVDMAEHPEEAEKIFALLKAMFDMVDKEDRDEVIKGQVEMYKRVEHNAKFLQEQLAKL